jgi:hypothetical protein
MLIKVHQLVEATAKKKLHCTRGALFLGAVQLEHPTWLASAPVYAQYLQEVYEKTNYIPDWLERFCLDCWKK